MRAPEKTRNSRLFLAACDLHGNSISEDQAIELLHPAASMSGLSDRVAAQGGTLSIESRVGEGTTLTAELPCGS